MSFVEGTQGPDWEKPVPKAVYLSCNSHGQANLLVGHLLQMVSLRHPAISNAAFGSGVGEWLHGLPAAPIMTTDPPASKATMNCNIDHLKLWCSTRPKFVTPVHASTQ